MLVEMLCIDLNLRMHRLSGGQRRGVQIMIGLILPFKFVLLDEITYSYLIPNNNNHATEQVI